MHPNPETGWIALLIIRRPFQRRGYGTEAASLLEQYIYSHATVKRIGLGVIVQNTPAQKFWEGCGYVRDKRTHDLQGHDCYEYYQHAYL